MLNDQGARLKVSTGNPALALELLAFKGRKMDR